MKKYFLIPIIAALIVTGFSFSNTYSSNGHVYAQGSTSVSGDEVCGATSTSKCTIADAKSIVRNLIINIVIPIGSALLVCFIIFRVLMAQKALMEGNTNAYKEAGKKIGNAIFGFFIIVAVVGGLLLAMLKFLGVDSRFLQLLADALVTPAYAQTYLPNPVGANNLYDFILLIVRLFIRWFVYPAILVMWVWTGFSFVAAQGMPEALAKAKKWLLWAIICTIVIFVTEGFMFALRGTINQILPGAAQTQTINTNGTSDGRTAPLPGQTGSTCMINGQTGQVGQDGVCYPGRGGSGATLSTSCAGMNAGTVCAIQTASGNRTGVCGMNAEQVYGCYSASINDVCITAGGQQGRIGANYQCQ